MEGRQGTDGLPEIAVGEKFYVAVTPASTTSENRIRGRRNITGAATFYPICCVQHIGYDAAQWLPPMNRCWFAARIVAVRLKYRLTVDRREAGALERILSGCASTAMIVTGE